MRYNWNSPTHGMCLIDAKQDDQGVTVQIWKGLHKDGLSQKYQMPPTFQPLDLAGVEMQLKNTLRLAMGDFNARSKFGIPEINLELEDDINHWTGEIPEPLA